MNKTLFNSDIFLLLPDPPNPQNNVYYVIKSPALPLQLRGQVRIYLLVLHIPYMLYKQCFRQFRKFKKRSRPPGFQAVQRRRINISKSSLYRGKHELSMPGFTICKCTPYIVASPKHTRFPCHKNEMHFQKREQRWSFHRWRCSRSSSRRGRTSEMRARFVRRR